MNFVAALPLLSDVQENTRRFTRTRSGENSILRYQRLGQQVLACTFCLL